MANGVVTRTKITPTSSHISTPIKKCHCEISKWATDMKGAVPPAALLNGAMISHRRAISSVLRFAQCPVLPKLQRSEQHHSCAKEEMPVPECARIRRSQT